MQRSETVAPARALRRFLVTVVAAVAIAGCYAVSTQPDGWNRRAWGPLVPHQSFPGDCGLCHEPGRWDKLKPDFHFDHEQQTGYRLEGSHAQAACLRCHNDRGPVKAYLARGCAGCHVDPHQAELGNDCTTCHDQLTWRPVGAIADHQRTRFPLVGRHAAVTCDRCHPQAHVGRFEGADPSCEGCHADVVALSTTVDHLALGYTHDCQRCHLPTAWNATHFDHGAWPLAGAHRAAACSACHQNGVFRGTPTDCLSCHQSDYNGATNPDHVGSGFGTNCEACHNVVAWRPARFDHSSWPLTGRHAAIGCTPCHANNQYQGTPTDCVSCHQADYDGATNPDHRASGFGTQCELCHTTNGWVPSTWNHEQWFPINSGAHRNVQCAECHTTGDDTVFSCIDCHTHNKTKTDGDHRGVRGYVYASPNCYACHPRGKADD